MKVLITSHFPTFTHVDSLPPTVPVKSCFDDLLIPLDHPSRSPTDTYYASPTHCLRTHTSAHQSDLLRSGLGAFTCTGDVYRRDEIDRTHYPVFHQTEGVKLFDGGTSVEEIEDDLKGELEGMARGLFGEVEMRWVDAYFPFTEPSFELEIYYQGEWLEVLGCGVMQQRIIEAAGVEGKRGWAFGLGLERLAMVLFKIPDIRLFWSEDPRFHKQFKEGEVSEFRSYSKYPPSPRDISFWCSEEYHQNDLFELIRDEVGDEDLVEDVELFDEFTHPKTGRTSHAYRITYRSMDRSLTNDEVNVIQDAVRERVVKELGVELR